MCWLQLSAPSIALYACTIMSQPTADEERVFEESEIAKQLYYVQMQKYYLPFLHCMFALCLVGMVSSLHSLWMRWDILQQKEFSPAHLAFCFPTLSHTNAVQAYRASINAFSTMSPSCPFRRFVYSLHILDHLSSCRDDCKLYFHLQGLCSPPKMDKYQYRWRG